MARMALPPLPALQRFVDDELTRVPLLAEQALDGTITRLKEAMPRLGARERIVAHDLAATLLPQLRRRLADRFAQAFRDEVRADLARGGAARRAPPSGGLSLVDDSDVVVEIERSHAIDMIRSTCEHELRELQTFVAALVGDMEVTREHNPLRPEYCGTALWDAAQVFPELDYRIVFMRQASPALAQVMRRAFATACTRLEDAGVQPAAYRTVILPAGPRRPRPGGNSMTVSLAPDMLRLRENLAPQAGTAPAVSPTPFPKIELPVSAPDIELPDLAPAPTPIDPVLAEFIAHLFEAIATDRGIAPDVKPLLARLQPVALRVAAADPTALDSDRHPFWQFADRLAFVAETLPPPGDAQRERALGFLQGVVAQLAASPGQDAARYEQAAERIADWELQRLERRCHAAAAQVAQLQALEDQSAEAENTSLLTLPGTLDVKHLATIPAQLSGSAAGSPAPGSAWLAERHTGEWVRMFIQGGWVTAQLLWPGDRGRIFLFGDAAGPATWAIRRRALLALQAENLVVPFAPRSLLRDAARRLARVLSAHP